MNIGVIGIGNLGYNLSVYFSNYNHKIFVSDKDETKLDTIGFSSYSDNVDVIRNSDIIFCCVDTNILPSNFLDITNVMSVVEDFGVSFEDEIPLYNKTFVICSTLNPGDTKKIMEILNPMNLKVCYLPIIVQSNNILSSLSNLKTIVVGSLDSEVINTITDIFQPSKNNKLNVISMTSKSAEIYRLAYSSFLHTKINFANFLGELMLNYGTSDETKLLLKSLGYDNAISENNFNFGFGVGGPWIPTENRVLGQVSNDNRLEFVLPFVNEDFNSNHHQFVKKHFISLNPDKTTPFVFTGIGYKDNSIDITESPKFELVSDLLKDGYTVYIIESDEFIRNKKVVKELIFDFGEKVKFFKQGTSPKGVHINF
jgi:nucleotide sugar dehydrogenase